MYSHSYEKLKSIAKVRNHIQSEKLFIIGEAFECRRFLEMTYHASDWDLVFAGEGGALGGDQLGGGLVRREPHREVLQHRVRAPQHVCNKS